jgi:hypothetical protein
MDEKLIAQHHWLALLSALQDIDTAVSNYDSENRI